MALDVGNGVAWLERTEDAVVLGQVQAMEARGTRLPDKLIREFRAMLVVLRHQTPSKPILLWSAPTKPKYIVECSRHVHSQPMAATSMRKTHDCPHTGRS